jgi:lipopolysaccharide biosynthesis glycosyltransferase
MGANRFNKLVSWLDSPSQSLSSACKAETLIVTAAFDDNYVYPGILSILSIERASALKPLFVFGYDPLKLSETNFELLNLVSRYKNLNLEVRRIELDPAWKNTGHISTMTLAKPILADLVSDSHIWFDSDAFLLRDISDFVQSFDSKSLGMVPHWRMSLESEEELRKAGDKAFYNAGVIFWPESAGNRSDWRRYISEIGQTNLMFGDQEVLNRVYFEDIRDLPGELNSNFSLGRLEQLNRSAAVAHFLGSQKPWLVPSSSREICASVNCGFSAFWRLESKLLSEIMDVSLLAHLSAALSRTRANQSFKASLIYSLPQLVKFTKASRHFHPYCHSDGAVK